MTRSMLQPNVKAELRPGKVKQSIGKEGGTCSLCYLLALLVAVIFPVLHAIWCLLLMLSSVLFLPSLLIQEVEHCGVATGSAS